MVTELLLINPKLQFTVTIKQALERTGAYTVHPFTTAEAALDFLRDNPQTVALVDLTLPGVDSAALIARLRSVQDDLPIVVSPAQPPAVIARLGVQGSIRMPFSARDVIPMLERAVELTAFALDPALEQQFRPPADTDNEADTGFSSLDDVLQQVGDNSALFESNIEADDTQAFAPDDADDPFRDLVDSMKQDVPRQPLPQRVPFFEFTLPDEMESRLHQIDAADEANDALFERLRGEEPPRPAAAEGGTIGDLMTGIEDESFRAVLSILRGQEDDTPPVPFAPVPDVEPGQDVDRGGRKSPARVILEATFDDSTPLEVFSLDNLIQSIRQQLSSKPDAIRPLPSWQDESSRLMEPDFLEHDLPDLEDADLLHYQTTIPSRAQTPDELPVDFETESLQLPSIEAENEPQTVVEYPAVTEPDSPDDETEADAPADSAATEAGESVAPEPDDEATPIAAELPRDEALPHLPVDDLESALFDTAFNAAADFDLPITATGEYEAAAPLELPDIDDPQVARVALKLTQVSLELAAVETLLSRNGVIIARGSSQLLRDDLLEIQSYLAGVNPTADGEALYSVIELSSSGKDYLLYSRHTVNDLLLTMVFSRDMALGDIRRQFNRLTDALETVPTVAPDDRSIEPLNDLLGGDPAALAIIDEDTLERTPVAFVWITHNPKHVLNPHAAQAIMAGLNTRLSERRWRVHKVLAEREFVQVYAEVPGETAEQELVRDLKKLAADILRSHDQTQANEPVWSDGYLVIIPGRPVEFDEILSFIEFERMR